MKTRNLFFAGTATCALALVASATVSAATLEACPGSFTADGTAKVYNGGSSAASACQYLAPPDNNNVANETNVNTAAGTGFFGFSDWSLAPGGADQLEPANGQQGTWSIPGVDFATYDYMLTFKDGRGTNLISFLLNELFSSGNWSSPFTSEAFSDLNEGQVKGVSHYSLFRRSNPVDVPEPASLGLLGLGLIALRFGRRARKM